MLEKLARKKLKKSLEKILCWYKIVICRYNKIPPRERLKKVQKGKSWGKSLKKIENNLGKKLKFRKNVEKIGEKKVEKKFRKNSMLVQKKLYVGTKKSCPERAWIKFEKVEERVWKKL